MNISPGYNGLTFPVSKVVIKRFPFPFVCFRTLQWLGIIWFVTFSIQAFGPGSAKQQQGPLRSDWGVNARRLWMLRASGRGWEMVMKELIASSGFWNRPPSPSAWSLSRTNGILMTKAKIMENDPAVWSIWKPQTCAGHVSIGNTFHPLLMDPYAPIAGLILLRGANITIYQFAVSIIHSSNAYW